MDSALNTPVPDAQSNTAVKQETSSPLAHSNQQPAAPAASALPVPAHSPPQPQPQQVTQHQEQRPAQPATNYTPPQAYPSPGMTPSMTPNPNQVQYYPAPQAPTEYRPSPDANGSLPLPSMRSLDSQQAQQQQQIQGQPVQQPYAVGTVVGQVGQLPPPVGVMPHYYGVGQTLPHPGHAYGDPNAQIRYALPPSDHRVMSGGRHKKEIKRRTKTGCLTCRKRRIKCDEQHPACRNCQKSKRECLGYDPIFKPQPGPSPIQPAPTSAAPISAAALATANPYGIQPSMQGYPYDPNMAQQGGAPHYDYNVDPMNAQLDPSQAHAQHPQHVQQQQYAQVPAVPPKPVKIEELLIKLEPTEGFKIEEEKKEEIKQMYHGIYVPGLESFLETKWYGLAGGEMLERDEKLMEGFTKMLAAFMKTNEQSSEDLIWAYQVESHVVWALAKMVETAAAASSSTPAPDANGNGNSTPQSPATAAATEAKNESAASAASQSASTNGIPNPESPTEAAHRLHVFESLLSGTKAEKNLCARPPPPGSPAAASIDHHRLRELSFWHHLSSFVCLPIHSNDPSEARAVDEVLSALRNLLDGRENRDVLYSIAVARALGIRVGEWGEDDGMPVHLDEMDVRSKVLVAKRFVGDESRSGTTNVIRRLCELACRALGIGQAQVVMQHA